MNEADYSALCEACDQLLLAHEANDEVIATPWLHVIRPHPVFLDGYAELFGRQTANWKRRLRNLASTLLHLGKALIGNGKPWSTVGNLPIKCDLLIISHLLNDSFPGHEGDFYYGNVACELAEYGFQSTVALINYTDHSHDVLANSWRQAKIPRVILSPVLSFAAECRLFWRANIAARRLKCSASLQPTELARRVALRSAIEAASGGAISASRLGEQIKALVCRLQPSAIMVTYEGHSWERISFAAARSVLPQINCIGYQHAALFKFQHAAQRLLSDRYNPNVILTSGRVAQAQLHKNPQLHVLSVDTLGSNRFFTRQSAPHWRANSRKRRGCLVLPEGILSECNLLFGYTLQCAKLMREVDFIWRLHPTINYEALSSQNPLFRDTPSNIILSSFTLAEDIARSDWALYRGSTAIVQASVSGVIPFYLRQVDEIPIDPLHEIAELHACVDEPADLAYMTANVESIEASSKFEQLQDYCEQMFTPMDYRVLAACVSGTRQAPMSL